MMCFIILHGRGQQGAARNDMPLQTRNIASALQAAELAAKLGCNTFVGASSQAEYGRTEQLLSPETPVFPENGYGMAKLCAGQMGRIRCQELGIKHVWVRILSVYGPFDGPNTMVSATLRKLLCGEHAAFTPAEQQWDYLYSEDAARALFLVAEHGKVEKSMCLEADRYVRCENILIAFVRQCVSGWTHYGYRKDKISI